jgi:hypothetical protein
MAQVCNCGLLKVRKVGTSTVDGFEVCNNCGRPLEFRAVVSAGADGQTIPADAPYVGSDYPSFWVIWGAVLIVMSLVLGTVVIRNDGNAFFVFVAEIGTIAGILMVLVGVIAKGVAIGMATDRRSNSR